MNADPSVRSAAVTKLLKQLLADDVSEDEKVCGICESASELLLTAGSSHQQAVKEALRLQVQDSDQAVLETFYSTPESVLPVILEDAEGYISSLVMVLHTVESPPSKSVTRTHLVFLANHLFPALSSALAERVFQEILFPLLLFSKSKQKTANLVWEILESRQSISGQQAGIESYELLGGCVDAVRWQEASGKTPRKADDPKSVDDFSRINIAFASKIAGNVFLASRFTRAISNYLLQKT